MRISTRFRLSAGLALLCAAISGGCESGETTTPNGSQLELPSGVDPVEFALDTVQIRSGDTTYTLPVEIADTPAQRERGLMYRSSMPEEAGMLFAYEDTQPGGAFWMYNTLIPLSIAYADAEGRIVSIVEMPPCDSEFASLCPTYPAGAPFRYALEVNQGYFVERGIGVGDRIVLGG